MMGMLTPFRFQFRKEIHAAMRFYTFKQALNQLIIPPNGDPLIGIVEIAAFG